MRLGFAARSSVVNFFRSILDRHIQTDAAAGESLNQGFDGQFLRHLK
jgi:hypothetical protein